VPDGERPAHPSPRRDHGAPDDARSRVRHHALAAAEGLFGVDPLLGDPLVQHSVDAFVEHAVDALRAIAERADQTDRSWAPDAAW